MGPKFKPPINPTQVSTPSLEIPLSQNMKYSKPPALVLKGGATLYFLT